jgi:hypothetical protein
MVPETEDVWVCGKCKEKISETDKFCKNCGEPKDTEINLNSLKEKKGKKKKSKDILPIILAAIAIVFIYFFLNSILSFSTNQEMIPSDLESSPTYQPEVGPTYQPVPIQTTESYGNLLIDNISKDLDNFHDKGWQDLYERNEFDCSRMSTYMWNYIRTKYKTPPKILISNEREHAWVALRVSDVGDTDRYEHWTIKGVDYYFLESTYPNIVKNIPNYQMGDIIYTSSTAFYTTSFYIADDPQEATDIAGRWSREFRLIKSDLDKLNAFKQ